jgi:hypothetical protein
MQWHGKTSSRCVGRDAATLARTGEMGGSFEGKGELGTPVDKGITTKAHYLSTPGPVRVEAHEN